MARKKKVLFVIHSLGGGGAEKILVNIANALNPDLFDVTVMSIVDSGYHRGHLSQRVKYRSLFSLPGGSSSRQKGESFGVSGSLLAGKRRFKNQLASLYYGFWKVAPVGLLYRHAVKDSYDVEVSFLEGICAKFVSRSWNRGSRKVCWIHVDVLKEGKSHRAFLSLASEKRCYDAFDGLVAVSEGVSDSFCKYLALDKERMRVLRNPLSIDEIRQGALEPIPSEDEALLGEFTFCSIGRLCEKKAFDRLIDAAAILKEKGLDFSVLILGEGGLEQALRSQIEEKGLGETVHLLGFKVNPYAYLARSDAYVCTSIAEGMSTTVSEAVILGLPVVSTDCSGTRELMAVAKGEIVGDAPESIAEGMARIMCSPREGRESSRLVEEFFDFDGSMGLIEAELFGED